MKSLSKTIVLFLLPAIGCARAPEPPAPVKPVETSAVESSHPEPAPPKVKKHLRKKKHVKAHRVRSGSVRTAKGPAETKVSRQAPAEAPKTDLGDEMIRERLLDSALDTAEAKPSEAPPS